jgi:UDP-N-acetylmuramoyl-tripeptide--D-alanyl-D-alanine ligase
MMRVQGILDAPGPCSCAATRERWVHGVSTDTRALRPQQLFLALSGPNFDGNAVRGAGEPAGAGALLLRGPSRASAAPVPRVTSRSSCTPSRAARSPIWRRGIARAASPVIGITGSCGKTTTKNILAQLLATRLRTVASPNSFNNDVGVPHTMLLADATTQALVLEIGTNARARSRRCRHRAADRRHRHHDRRFAPRGPGFDRGRRAREVGAARALPKDGFAVINSRQPPRRPAARFDARARDHGQCRGRRRLNATHPLFHAGGTTFRLRGHEVTSPLLGQHNISNLLCALAACRRASGSSSRNSCRRSRNSRAAAGAWNATSRRPWWCSTTLQRQPRVGARRGALPGGPARPRAARARARRHARARSPRVRNCTTRIGREPLSGRSICSCSSASWCARRPRVRSKAACRPRASCTRTVDGTALARTRRTAAPGRHGAVQGEPPHRPRSRRRPPQGPPARGAR